MGDNLGSHSVRRFNTNFSSSSFFCRYSSIKIASVSLKCVLCNHTILRCSANCKMASLILMTAWKWILHLMSYSFTMFALTWTATMLSTWPFGRNSAIWYDFTWDARKLKWFSLKFLNQLMSTFKFCSFDVRLYPPTISKNSKKLSGNASENGCFLRHFPFLVLSHVTDSENSVWKLILETNNRN